jgi:hypothetical protein
VGRSLQHGQPNQELMFHLADPIYAPRPLAPRRTLAAALDRRTGADDVLGVDDLITLEPVEDVGSIWWIISNQPSRNKRWWQPTTTPAPRCDTSIISLLISESAARPLSRASLSCLSVKIAVPSRRWRKCTLTSVRLACCRGRDLGSECAQYPRP